MSQPKPPKPQRQFPSIAAVFSGGRWRWRACITVDRRQHTGPLRDNQRVAFADAEALRARAWRSTKIVTIFDACAAVIERAKRRGLEPHMVESVWRKPCRALLRYFAPDVCFEALTTDVVRAYALWCLDGDPTLDKRGKPIRRALSPSTVRKEYLRVLHACFEVAQFPSPVPAVLVDIAQRMRRAPAVVIGFDIEEVRALLARVREWEGRTAGAGTAVDAMLFALVATTGLRTAELARVRVRDVHLEQGVIQVRAKSAANPRLEPIVPELAEALAKHVAQLPGPDSPIVPARGKPNPRDAPWAAQGRYLNRMVMRWKKRLGEPRLHLRALRRAHGTGLDAQGAPYAVVRDGLGHSRTSDETPRYLLSTHRAVTAAKTQLASRLLGKREAPRGDDEQPADVRRPPGPGGAGEDLP